MKYIFNFVLFILSFNDACVLANETSYKLIYLATFPRSGNHWTRYLIEEAAHVTTSSVYEEPNHSDMGAWGGYYQPNGYYGNCQQPTNEETVVLKTHFPFFEATAFDLRPNITTIRIIRHPIDSMYSLFVSGNIDKYGQRIPPDSLKYLIDQWRVFQEYWDQQENILNIYYEDLLEDPYYYFSVIMAVAGYKINDEDILRSIKKFPPQGKALKHLACFTKEDREQIQEELSSLLHKHDYVIPMNKD